MREASSRGFRVASRTPYGYNRVMERQQLARSIEVSLLRMIPCPLQLSHLHGCDTIATET